MAGNNAIQFCRGTSTQRSSHTEVSLAGQPIYETDTNKLYVGDGATQVRYLQPISADIPSASQSTLGGVKVWEDSSGYLHISTS